jgi:hypothetical protein
MDDPENTGAVESAGAGATVTCRLTEDWLFVTLLSLPLIIFPVKVRVFPLALA